MKNFINIFYNAISNKFYFKILYLFVSLTFATVLSYIPGLHILNTFLILWGIFLIGINLIDFIILKRIKFYIFQIPLYLFLCLTLFLNLTQYKLQENLKVWIINVMILTVMFSIDNYKKKEQLENELSIISYFYTIFTFLLSSISLIMIFTNKIIEIPLGLIDGAEQKLIYIGLFKNENSFGIAAAISLLISLYLIFICKEKAKIFFIVNIVIQLISVFISSGRSAFLLLLALPFILLFLKFKKTLTRTLMIVIPAIIGLVSFFTLPENILHKIFTGREYLWQTAFRLIKTVPLVGVGNVNKVGRLQDVRVTYLQGVEAGGVHNIFLEIACVNGVIATLLFVIFMVLLAYFFIKKISLLPSYEVKKYSTLLSLYLGIILVNLMESSLVYIISFISIIFWVYSGYLVAILEKELSS